MSEPHRSSGDCRYNPRWETIDTDCFVCGSDFGDGPEDVRCLRVRMDHCSAFYGCICLKCARLIHDAIEEHDSE